MSLACLFMLLACQRQAITDTKFDMGIEADTISFLGDALIMNDSIMSQIQEIASHSEILSIDGNILKMGDVRWGINLDSTGIYLLTSIQPDDLQMMEVVKYLSSIYGEPYQNEEDDMKWHSSSDNRSTSVHLRRVHSEEGGTFLIFQSVTGTSYLCIRL